MAWIRMIHENEADTKLKEYYDEIARADVSVDNILKIHSLNPESLRGHYDYYKTLMYGKSGLSRIQREMIAVVVSATNRCRY